MKKIISIFILLSLISPGGITLPQRSEAASIVNSSIASMANAPTVYYLQDAHESLSAQKQIAEKIYDLTETKPIRAILFEGAEGLVIGNDFKQGLTREQIQKASDYFLEKGYLGAAEYAYLNTEENYLLWGVEKKDAYLNNLKQFRKLLRNETEALRVWNSLEQISAFPSNNFKTSPNKKQAEKLIEQLDSSQLDLVSWMQTIEPLLRSNRFSLVNYPVTRQLLELIRIVGDPLNQIPDSQQRVETLMSQMKGKELFQEIEELVWLLREQLAASEEERQWVQFRFWLFKTKKMCLGKAIPDDLRIRQELQGPQTFEQWLNQFQSLFSKQSFRRLKQLTLLLDVQIKTATEFYETVDARSEHMFKQTMNYIESSRDNHVVLVAGGFHAEKLQELFEAKDIAFKQWHPELLASDRVVPYRRSMTQTRFRPFPSRSTIRRQTPFDPLEGSLDRGEALALFHMQAGVGINFPIELRKKEWADGNSLGGTPLQIPLTWDGLFQALLQKNRIMDGQGRDVLKETRGKPNVYLVHPKFGTAPNFLRELFQNEVIKEEIIARYTTILTRGFLVRDVNGSVHLDLLIFVIHQLANDIINESVSFKITKEMTEAAQAVINLHREREQLIWKLRDAVNLPEALITSKEKRFKRWQTVRSQLREVIGLVYQQKPKISAEVSERLQAFLKQGYFRFEDRDYALDDLEQGRKPTNMGLIHPLIALEELPSMVGLLQGWRTRFKLREQPDVGLKHLLQDYVVREAIKQGVKTEPPEDSGQLEQFLISRSATIFRYDAKGQISNWDEVLLAFIDLRVRYNTDDKQRFGGLTSTQLGLDQDVKTDRDREDFMAKAWQLFFLLRHSEREEVPIVARFPEWRMLMATELDKDELNVVQGIKNVKALVFERTPNIFEQDQNPHQIVAVYPNQNMAINPYVTIENPTDQIAFFRVDQPGTREERVALVTDVEEIRLFSALITSEYKTFIDAEIISYEQSGFPETDLLQPLKKLKSFRGGERAEEIPASKFEVSSQDKRSILRDQAKQFVNLIVSFDPAKLLNYEQYIKDSRADLFRLKESFSEGTNGVLPEVKGFSEIIDEDSGSVELRYAIGDNSYGLFLSADTLTFQANLEEGRKSFLRYSPFRQQGNARSILGIDLEGDETAALVLVAAYKYFLSHQLSPEQKKVLDRWEPSILFLHQRYLNQNGRSVAASSLGAALLEADISMDLSYRPLTSRDLFEHMMKSLSAEGVDASEITLSKLSEGADGYYENFIYWKALRKGILISNLVDVLEQFPNLTITLVDEDLTQEDLLNQLRMIDPEGMLSSFIASGQLGIPEKPQLNKQLSEAREKLRGIYGNNYQSFLAVIASEDDMASRQAMLSQARDAQRFLLQGEHSLGSIARVVFSLINGNPEAYFYPLDPSASNRDRIWTIAPSTSALINALSEIQQAQLQLQIST